MGSSSWLSVRRWGSVKRVSWVQVWQLGCPISATIWLQLNCRGWWDTLKIWSAVSECGNQIVHNCSFVKVDRSSWKQTEILNSWGMKICQHYLLKLSVVPPRPWFGEGREKKQFICSSLEVPVSSSFHRIYMIENTWHKLRHFAVSSFPLNPIVRAEYFNLKGGGDDNNKSGDKSLFGRAYFFTLVILVGFEVAKGISYLSEPFW